MAKRKRGEEVREAITGAFDIGKFKQKNRLSTTSVKFKEQSWIPISVAVEEALNFKGIPKGHITLLRGHSDTGKTSALLAAAASAQKMGILPVFIITEMKWSWEHAKLMGVQFEEKVDQETGEIYDYEGMFLFYDRSTINSIEDVAGIMLDLIDKQKDGELPMDLLFLWDSIGSVPCELSIKSNKNNNEWNAGAMSQQFGNYVNQKILLSRKEGEPYTNTLVAINKVWVQKPSSPMAQPRLRNKGGDTMFFDASLILTFGNLTSPGTQIIKATHEGKSIEFAKITKVRIEKNHISGVNSSDKIVVTPHGFLKNDKKEIDLYKREYRDYWNNAVGTINFNLEIEAAEEDDSLIETVIQNDE